MPQEGFSVNGTILKLASVQTVEVSRGQACENLKASHKALEGQKRKLSELYNEKSGESTIDGVCNKQIELINQSKEELVNILSEQAEILTQRVIEFKNECLANYSNIDEAVREQAKKTINNTDALIQQHKEVLNRETINDQETIEANKTVLQMKEDVDKVIMKTKKLIFGNKTIEFKSNPTQSANMIGCVYIGSTVIFNFKDLLTL
jgi:hypothetical protein